MKIINKIPKTLKLIKENFISFYENYNFEYNIEIEETDEYYVELISMKSQYWYFNLARFLKDKNFELIVLKNDAGWYGNPCSKNTLIIKYWKDTDKLQIKVNNLEIRPNADNKLKYVKYKKHLFSLNKKGCYTVLNNNVFKLSINTVFKFENNFRYGKCLLTELYPDVIKFINLDYLPLKFKDFESTEAIIKYIDPKNKGKNYSINTLIFLYHFLYKKDFNELLKYSDRMILNKSNLDVLSNAFTEPDFKDLWLNDIISLYYLTRYPVQHKPLISSIQQINNLFNVAKKIKLVHPKKLEKYLSDGIKNKRRKINKKFNKNLCINIGGYKRLINKLLKPSLEFTWELLDNNKKIINAINEIYCDSSYFIKSCYIKIYYKRNTIILNVKGFNMHIKSPEDTPLSIYNSSEYKTKLKYKILSFIDRDISEKLHIKSNSKFGCLKKIELGVFNYNYYMDF